MLAKVGALQFELERVDEAGWDGLRGQRFLRLESGDEVSRHETRAGTFLLVDHRRADGLARVERWRCVSPGEAAIAGLIVLCDSRRAG